MSFTNENDYEIQDSGAADWDSGLNTNFQLLEKGLTFRGTAGIGIASGSVIAVNSAGYVLPFNPSSLSGPRPRGFSRAAISSGAAGFYHYLGVVRSLTVGSLFPGEPCFAVNDPASLGLVVASYAGCRLPIGDAIDQDAFVIRPYRLAPDISTYTTSGGALGFGVASAWNFTLPIGPRGYLSRLEVGATSLAAMAYKVQLHSGSSRVTSELVYETLTRSWATLSSDVTSAYYLDAQGFPYKNTDVSSYALLFGRIQVQSIHGTSSGDFSITVEFARYD